MLCYDDSTMPMVPRARLGAASHAWSAAGDRGVFGAHAARVGAFISVSQILQGVADAAFATSGLDDETQATRDIAAVLHAMAGCIADGATPPDEERLAAATRALDRLAGGPADGHAPDWRDAPVACRPAEGYAFYALYPEAFMVAARGSGLGPDTQVIGLRSIGAGLAAMVAAGLGAAPAATLRPTGHPFARTVLPGRGLRRRWLGAGDVAFAVVDEGPGLSGSSFRAVVQALEDLGIDGDRIHLFPSHDGGPGPRAPAGWGQRWQAIHRHAASADAFLLEQGASAPPRLAAWVGDVVRAPVREVADLSAGSWRSRFWADPSAWPAAAPISERRKVLATTDRGDVLARFAGLGSAGEESLALARALAACGFVPQPLGLRHGFLVERWHGDARPMVGEDDRSAVMEHLPSYLAARAHLFPALGRRGASLATLAAMVERNAGLRLGPDGAEAAAALVRRAGDLGERVRPVRIDGRLDLHEWLQCPDGRILKADAVDHHDDHGLVGCQDLAWDVAGASVEFELSREETDALRARIAARGTPAPDAELVAFYRPCYAAYRMGADVLAQEAAGEGADAARLARRADRYAGVLRQSLGLGPG
jgi:hypothetical protein